MIFQIGGLANSAYGFLLLPLYVRHINPREFGVLSMLMVALQLMSIVLKFGLNQAFFHHYHETEDPVRRHTIVGTALIFLLISSTCLLVLLYPLSGELSHLLLGRGEFRPQIIKLLLFVTFFEVITLVPDSILRAHFKSARYSMLSIIALAFQLLSIAIVVVFVDSSAYGVMIGRLAGTAFEAAIFFFAVRSELSFAFSLSELKGLLSFGSPLILGQVLSTLFVIIDRFFVEKYGALRDVGIYSLSNSVVSLITILVIGPFGQVWSVMRFSVMKDKDAEEYYSRVLTYIVLVSMFLALGISAVAGDGLILKGGGYSDASRIIPMLALGAVFDSGSRVLNVGITSKGKTLYSPFVTGAALAINIALNFLLIPKYGTVGATISTMLSLIAFCAVRFAVSNLFIKVEYDWVRVFNSIAIGGLIMLAFYAVDGLRGPAPSPAVLYLSIAVKTLLALSFPAVLYLVGFYDARERKKLAEAALTLYGAVRQRRVGLKAEAAAPASGEETPSGLRM